MVPSPDILLYIDNSYLFQTCQLTILDDDFDPRREGNETFVVFLSSATGSTLAEPHLASVVIHDSTLDSKDCLVSCISHLFKGSEM